MAHAGEESALSFVKLFDLLGLFNGACILPLEDLGHDIDHRIHKETYQQNGNRRIRKPYVSFMRHYQFRTPEFNRVLRNG